MAKTKTISLKKIVREIKRAEAQVSKAKKIATPEGKKALALAIKDLRSVRIEAISICHGVYTFKVLKPDYRVND